MKKAKIIPEKIHIKKVIVFKSSIDIKPEKADLLNEIDGYSFSFAKNTGVSFENKIIRYRLNILLEAKDKQGTLLDIKGEFGIEFIFYVDNFEGFSKKEGDRYLLDESLGNTLMSIAYSTSRGIVLQETQSTVIGGVILPVINPSDLMDESTL